MPMSLKLYVISLSAEERSFLRGLIAKGKVAAHKRLHAQILLKADAGPQGEAWPDQRIAEALDAGVRTVERLRQRCVEEGLEAALERKPQLNRIARKLDGRAEAHLIAAACGKPPEGRQRWTLKLLAGRLVELELVDSVSYETVRRTLKKTKSSRG
jgi:transposase